MTLYAEPAKHRWPRARRRILRGRGLGCNL